MIALALRRRIKMHRRLSAVSSFLLLTISCGSEIALEPDVGKTKSAERIDDNNNPDRFRLSMVRRIEDLPYSGVSLRQPFPSNWWPMREGGIANRWNDGDWSPSEKYDLLATPERIRPTPVTRAERDYYGRSVPYGGYTEYFDIGPATRWELENHGRHGEIDPDSWWGHCNGWASYVLNEDEPIHPVSVRMQGDNVVECVLNDPSCVRFEVGDINALGAEIYWDDASYLVGRRCELGESGFWFDNAGRISNPECRDGNAGTFHIVTTNMLGILERPFIVDLNADHEVWNYPVYAYEIVGQTEISLDSALWEVDAPYGTRSWVFNQDAQRFVRVSMRAYIVEDAIPPSTEASGDLLAEYTTVETYDYILELDWEGNILGGEWIGISKTHHPDFLWYSLGSSVADDDDVEDGDNPAIQYSVFKQILSLAQGIERNEPNRDEPVSLTYYSIPFASIPDDDAFGILDSIEVPDDLLIEEVVVAVAISHSYVGDLSVTLSNSVAVQPLHQNTGGSRDDLYRTYDIVTFRNGSSNGRWELEVVDNAAQDVGVLEGWAITFVGRPLAGVQ